MQGPDSGDVRNSDLEQSVDGSNAVDDWVDLLLHEAPSHEFPRHRDLMVRRGLPKGAAEHQLTGALILRSLLEQRRRRAAELAALNDIAGRLASVTSLRPLLQEIVEQAKHLLRVDLAYLSLVQDEHIKIEVATGQISEYLSGLQMPLSKGFGTAVMSRAAPVWTSDYTADRGFSHYASADTAAQLENIRGLLGVPLSSRGVVIGVLFAAKRQERNFAPDEVQLLAALAAHASIALENSRVFADQQSSAQKLHIVNAQLEARTCELENILKWDRTLTQVVLHGGDINDLLSEVSKAAGCSAFFLRNTSEIPEGLRDIDESVIADIRRIDHESENCVEFELETTSVLAHLVVASRDVLGTLMLRRGVHEIRPDHPMLLERAAPSLALSLIGQHAAEEAARKTKDRLLIDLLTRPISERREAEQQARLVGLDPSEIYCVVVMLPNAAKAQVERALSSLTLPERSVVGDYGKRLVLLIPATNADELALTWLDHEDLHATVGVAGPMRDVTELRRCFRDAQQTVDVMLTLSREGQIGTAERLGIYRILLNQSGPYEVDRLIGHHLGTVLMEEKRNGVPLLQTLEVYLRHSQRHGVAAAELSIHPNTLYQRLDALSKLLGDDWRSPDRALDLQLILRLRASASQLRENSGP